MAPQTLRWAMDMVNTMMNRSIGCLWKLVLATSIREARDLGHIGSFEGKRSRHSRTIWTSFGKSSEERFMKYFDKLSMCSNGWG